MNKASGGDGTPGELGCYCQVTSVVSDSVRPQRRQPTRLPIPGILQARTLECCHLPLPLHESEKWKWNRCRVWLLATPWMAAFQAPPSMGFSRQEYWSGAPVPSPVQLKSTARSRQGRLPLCLGKFMGGKHNRTNRDPAQQIHSRGQHSSKEEVAFELTLKRWSEFKTQLCLLFAKIIHVYFFLIWKIHGKRKSLET